MPELKPLLLKRSELADIMADTDMQQLQAFEQPTRSNDIKITPPGCRNLALPAETAVWSPSTKALVGDANRGAGGQAVTQVVALMTSSAVAADTVNSILTAFWGAQCPPGQPFTMELDTGQQQWNPAAPQSSGQPQRISVTYTRADPPRSCTHAYTSANNVLIETLACGKVDTAAQAGIVLDRIAAKIS
ncbi:sensor domain-containing protein [Mycolicibacterium sp. Y3]